MYSLFSGLSMAEISGLTAIAIASCIFLSTLILPYSIFLAAFRWLDTLFHTSILLPLGLSSRVKLVYNKASSVKVGDSDLVALIKHNCPHLYGPQAWYTPPIWMLGSGHVQTALCATMDFTKTFRIEYERKHLNVPDGGQICIDITPPLRDIPPDRRPILVCAHGLTGGSHESYIRSVLDTLTRPIEEGGHGWRAVVVNSRGCANGPLKTAKLYNCGATYDIKNAILYIANMFPDAAIYGIGFSLGAGMMTKYLGTEAGRTPMKAGIVVGAPWDLLLGHINLQAGLRGLYYSRAMARNLLTLCRRHAKILQTHEKLDWEAVTGNPNMTLYEFDTVVTSRLGGFASTEDYYRSQSPRMFAHGIKVPFLALNAVDDPIATQNGIPLEAASCNPNLMFALTRHGGHLGWFEGLLSFHHKKRWVTKPIIEWLLAIHAADPTPLGHPGVKSIRAPEIGQDMTVDIKDPSCGYQEVAGAFITGGDEGAHGEMRAGL